MFAYLLRATVNKADLVEVRNAYKTPVCNLWILVCCKTVSSTCRQSKVAVLSGDQPGKQSLPHGLADGWELMAVLHSRRGRRSCCRGKLLCRGILGLCASVWG